MWIPVAGLPPWLRLSALAGAGSGAATGKHLPARNRRGLSDSSPQLWPNLDFRNTLRKMSKSSLDFKRYVTNRRLAETLALKQNRPPHLLLQCNPGPGILTQALLEVDAKAVALESDKTFIAHLESLGKNLDGKLQVSHCDFFKIDPRSEAVPWTAVTGMFPSRGEERAFWKPAYDLYSSDTRNPDFVIWHAACEIKVLHMEPWSSFDVYTRNGQLENPKHRELLELLQHNLYLIRMTPCGNLFTKNLTLIHYNIFFHMLKHCFVRRSANVIDHLRSLTPLDAMDILPQIGKKEEEKITNVYPQNFKKLFETIECSKDCAYKWLYDETLEDT
uniref:rRNA adenine N(6)-methyltransferase n=1 Tax=Macaca nemestrina TaxID=9545 RepID=A0A2K6EA53_MACNE